MFMFAKVIGWFSLHQSWGVNEHTYVEKHEYFYTRCGYDSCDNCVDGGWPCPSHDSD